MTERKPEDISDEWVHIDDDDKSSTNENGKIGPNLYLGIKEGLKKRFLSYSGLCLCGNFSDSNVHYIIIKNDTTNEDALATIDTGSELNLISSDLLRRLGIEPILDEEKPEIIGINGGPCLIGGYVDLKWHGRCRWKTKRYTARFWVCIEEVPFEVLVGHKTLVDQGALSYHAWIAVNKKQSKKTLESSEAREARKQEHEKERALNREKVSKHQDTERQRVIDSAKTSN